MSNLPFKKLRRPDYGDEIPNEPFGDRNPNTVDIGIKTTGGILVIENAIVRENSVKVDPQSFLEGGFDLGTF